MRYFILILALFLTLFVAGCGKDRAVLPSITPYKMDIQQGNAVTPKMMMQLRPGMTKSQVRFIMGTPLLVDSFHADRWDYFYQMRKEGKIVEQRRVILEFEGDALKRVRGDVIPAGSDPSAVTVQPITEPSKSSTMKREEKGLLDRLKFWESDEKAKTKPEVAPKPEPQAAPVVEQAKQAVQEGTAPVSNLPEIAPQAIPETLPPLMEEVAPESKSAAPTKAMEPVKPVAKPAVPPQAEKVAEPKPSVKEAPAPRAEPRVESKPQVKTAPQPPKDLPPEDAPDFFEKMLEKIGF